MPNSCGHFIGLTPLINSTLPEPRHNQLTTSHSSSTINAFQPKPSRAKISPTIRRAGYDYLLPGAGRKRGVHCRWRFLLCHNLALYPMSVWVTISPYYITRLCQIAAIGRGLPFYGWHTGRGAVADCAGNYRRPDVADVASPLSFRSRLVWASLRSAHNAAIDTCGRFSDITYHGRM